MDAFQFVFEIYGTKALIRVDFVTKIITLSQKRMTLNYSITT